MTAQNVKMVVLDVDGVLTDGGIIIDGRGVELKRFNVHDGLGIKFLQRSGIHVAIISGRESEATTVRAKQLKIDHVFQGAMDKVEKLEELKRLTGVRDEEIAYIGDDLIDIPVLRRIGFPVAPANARNDVKKLVSYVTEARGGHGAVRELAEHILKAQNRWAGQVERYLR